jgi:hypothetical protein
MSERFDFSDKIIKEEPIKYLNYYNDNIQKNERTLDIVENLLKTFTDMFDGSKMIAVTDRY